VNKSIWHSTTQLSRANERHNIPGFREFLCDRYERNFCSPVVSVKPRYSKKKSHMTIMCVIALSLKPG
jgi:hypothetical protein